MDGSATVTSKGQVTIPAAIRDKLGIEPGHKLVFFIRPDGQLGVRVSKPKVGSGRGILKELGVELPEGDIDEHIEEAIAQRAADVARIKRD